MFGAILIWIGSTLHLKGGGENEGVHRRFHSGLLLILSGHLLVYMDRIWTVTNVFCGKNYLGYKAGGICLGA